MQVDMRWICYSAMQVHMHMHATLIKTWEKITISSLHAHLIPGFLKLSILDNFIA